MAVDASPRGASVRGFASAIRLRRDLGLFSFEQNSKKSWYVPLFPDTSGTSPFFPKADPSTLMHWSERILDAQDLEDLWH